MRKGEQLEVSQKECDDYFANLSKTGRPKDYKLETTILRRDNKKQLMIYSCTGCIWLNDGLHCPFVRRVKRQGWKADGK